MNPPGRNVAASVRQCLSNLARARGIEFQRMLVLYALSHEFGFQARSLTAAVRDVFARRGTAIPTEAPDGLTQEFAGDVAKLVHWKAFLKQNVSPPRDTLELSHVIAAIATFLLPVLEAAAGDGTNEERVWAPGGPWKQEDTASTTREA